MQALICRRRINEDLASGILTHDSISRRILIYRRISHTRSRSIRSSRIRSSRNLVSGSHLTDLLLHRRQCQSLRHSQQCRREEKILWFHHIFSFLIIEFVFRFLLFHLIIYIRLINKLCKYMKKGRLLHSSLPPRIA